MTPRQVTANVALVKAALMSVPSHKGSLRFSAVMSRFGAAHPGAAEGQQGALHQIACGISEFCSLLPAEM